MQMIVEPLQHKLDGPEMHLFRIEYFLLGNWKLPKKTKQNKTALLTHCAQADILRNRYEST